MKHASVTVCCACLLVLACATPSSSPTAAASVAAAADWKLASASVSQGTTFQASAPPNQVSVQISGSNISGADYNLAVGKDFVRGQGVGGTAISVTLSGNRADGSVGGKKFSVVLDPQADGSARVSGLMGAGMSDFTLSPAALTGRIGLITYSLAFNGTRYQGSITPGGTAYIAFPAAMAGWTDLQVVTVLGVLLTR
jgi:hypothetical protein